MKVCMLTYGVFNYTVALASALSKHCGVDAYFSDYHLRREDPRVLDVLAGRCNMIRFGRHRTRDPRSLFSTLRLCGEIRRHDYDVIHVQEYPDLWMSLCWRLCGDRPTVVTVHDPMQHPGLPPVTRVYQDFMQNLSVRRAQKYIVLGQSLKENLLNRYGVAEDAVNIIPHGDNTIEGAWDETPDQDGDTSRKVILFFGEIRPNKGLEYLLQAEPLLQGRLDDYEIVIAGRCDDFGRYARYIRPGAPITARLDFIPNSEVPALFRRASVVVLPYISATQSGVIPMAYAYGKPVIASKVGALPDVVSDGYTGLLIEPANPAAIADAIVAVLSDESQRLEMGRHGRLYCRYMLDWDAIAVQTMHVYESALKNAAAPRRRSRRKRKETSQCAC
jgi:glycosyltransferase involved in cell wall biosynthesis